MKTKFILLLFIGILFQNCGNKNLEPKPEAAKTEQAKPEPVDTAGARTLPVMIGYIKQIDSIAGFAVVKATVNEKTLQPELKLIEYLDANSKPLGKEIRTLAAIKR